MNKEYIYIYIISKNLKFLHYKLTKMEGKQNSNICKFIYTNIYGSSLFHFNLKILYDTIIKVLSKGNKKKFL